MIQHIWSVAPGLLSTLAGLFAYLKAKEASKKSDVILIQTNGTQTRLYNRNSQLAAELAKNNIPIPPPIGEKPHEGNS